MHDSTLILLLFSIGNIASFAVGFILGGCLKEKETR